MTPLPTIFVSHGSPMLALQDSPARRFLSGLGQRLPRPAAIAVVPALLDYRQRAPMAAKNRPTDEHLPPLYVALGAAGPGAKATLLHTGVEHGVLAMDAWAFDAPD